MLVENHYLIRALVFQFLELLSTVFYPIQNEPSKNWFHASYERIAWEYNEK